MKSNKAWYGMVQQAKDAARYAVTFSLLVMALSIVHIPKAEAARCSTDGSNCTYQERDNWYWCGLVYLPRHVRWQVPEGTVPAGGWRTAFFYNGTTPTDLDPFTTHPLLLNAFGMDTSPKIFQELLDNPAGTGYKYASFAPDPPATAVLTQFWHTNVITPYVASCDYSFFNDFFNEIKNGSYGAGSQYNMNQRYAYGISSGGYNTSRMAVTFNGSSVWKALAVISASYATCAGPLCVVPGLPANHPPTKFYHGTLDPIVPLFTMEYYYNKLIDAGKETTKSLHVGGHELSADNLGATGVKAWFDAH
ncbi:hypothetical protein [Undibacterium sp.]|uniref:hypothetical protein n=1 Tax=Undibacterium sp. TaxID=1914977 RepID=UPI002C55EE0F|nr:hypothetical protein [Undibacterium sp.]HTD03231.1 hypothetical protein [Undibacterium sp.]